MVGVWQIDKVEKDETDLVERAINVKDHLSKGFTFEELAPLEVRIEFAERLQAIRNGGIL